MKSATQTKTEGKADEMKGKAQETWGNLTNDDEDQAEGQTTQAKGHAKEAWGNVKSGVDKMTDKP